MFTARYGLIPYIKQIKFRLYRLNNTTFAIQIRLPYLRNLGMSAPEMFVEVFFLSKYACKNRREHKFKFGNKIHLVYFKIQPTRKTEGKRKEKRKQKKKKKEKGKKKKEKERKTKEEKGKRKKERKTKEGKKERKTKEEKGKERKMKGKGKEKKKGKRKKEKCLLYAIM